MKNLRVLMFGWEYAPLMTGGLGVVCHDMAESLVNNGVIVNFVLPTISNEVDSNQVNLINSSLHTDTQFKTHKITSILTPYMTVDSYYQTQTNTTSNSQMNSLYGHNLFEEIERYTYNASKIASIEKYDVIHVHDWMTFGAGIAAKKISGKPLIMHVHSTEYDRSGGAPYPEILKLEKNGLKQADLVVAVSNRTKNVLVDKYGIKSEKIKVVYNAINHDSTCENDNDNDLTTSISNNDISENAKKEKVVLFLGRLSIQKGADFLLKAAKLVIGSIRSEVRFVFVGKGDMLRQLIHQSIDLGIAKNVSFLGFLDHSEIDKAYKHADLFVMPSVSEPFGLTSLEAIKNGTPVIVSKQSGVAEVIPNTLKVDYWDTEDMANKILAVLKYTSLSNALISNGYYDLSKITWDSQTKQLIEEYKKL